MLIGHLHRSLVRSPRPGRPIIPPVATHIRPTGPIAPDALLPGDPKRAMDIAAALSARPLMSNLSRGLWGYHARTGAGLEITVQSSGLGGPSAAIVLEELASFGVRRAIRVGTCTALDPALAPAQVIVAERALAGDGVTASLGPAALPVASPDLTSALSEAAGAPPVTVASTDLLYDPEAVARRGAWRGRGAAAVDLSAAALFAVGALRGVEVACALVVAVTADGTEAAEEEIDAATLTLAGAAVTGLERAAQPSSSGTPRLP